MLLALAALAALPAIAPPRQEPRPVAHTIAVVRGEVPLRARPNGSVVAWAAARTEFGSPRALSVATRRGPWLGVIATELPNGRLAWVHRDNADAGPPPHGATRFTPTSPGAGSSCGRAGAALWRITVGIGASGSETPTGRFAVTDELSGPSYSASYGCCILALSGHQRAPAPRAGAAAIGSRSTAPTGRDDRRCRIGRLPARRGRGYARPDGARTARNPCVHQGLSS